MILSSCLYQYRKEFNLVLLCPIFFLRTLDDITVVLIDNPTYGTYSVFASPSMDVTGILTPEGAAVLLTFDLID